jgi:hypothetical protein
MAGTITKKTKGKASKSQKTCSPQKGKEGRKLISLVKDVISSTTLLMLLACKS